MALPAGIQLWDSRSLYALLRDDRLDPIPSHFRDTYFTTNYFSDDEDIKFAKLPSARRVMAPFVLPTEQGKPIFSRRGQSVEAFKPAYIKPKDVVRPEEAGNVLPSEIFNNGGNRPSLAQRFDARVVEVQNFHQRAINMQIAWMCARAFIDAKLTVSYGRDQGAANPEVTIDFGRAANQTIALSGTFWDSSEDYDILGNIQTWMDIMRLAPLGGSPTRMYVGSKVAGLFAKNTKIREQMNNQYRGNNVNVTTGLLTKADPLYLIGNLSPTLEVWGYSDQVENPDGTLVEMFDPRDILLVAPGATGIMAFGAIYDAEAMQSGNGMSVDIFPKMWVTKDPGEVYIMNQSSPLPIPMYPNRTLKARVLA